MINAFPELKTFVDKTTDISIKSIDFGTNMVRESLNYFDNVTDKAFYTYSKNIVDVTNKVAEYAKETIKSQKAPNLFSTSK